LAVQAHARRKDGFQQAARRVEIQRSASGGGVEQDVC
jgi:hypothetical protein